MMSAKNFAIIVLLIAVIGIVFSNIKHANTTYQHNDTSHEVSLYQGIDKIIAQFPEPAMIGIKIQDLKTGKVLYERNASQAFTPASNLKLLTAVAALIYLGPDYYYQTLFLTDAKQSETKNPQTKELKGNLYIKFTGDPDLTSSDLNAMFSQLSQQGIRHIYGNIYLDSTRYDAKNYGPGWMWDDLNYCYAAPVSAMLINHNCIDYSLTPATRVGSTAKLQRTDMSEFDANFIRVRNYVITQNTKVECTTDVTDSDSTHSTFDLRGCIPQGDKVVDVAIAIKDNNRYAKLLLATLLQKNHILLTGNIEPGQADESMRVLVVHQSKPLRLLVNELLKISDNLIANTILKTLGAAYYKQPGTWQNGVSAEKAILTQYAHLNFAKLVVVDGDGESRYNLITPDAMSQLLYYIYHNFTISPELVSALPIAGTDGTLDNRMVKQNIRLRAKTGTMTGVSSLSGYLETANHRLVSFTILTDNHIGSDDAIKKMQDKICLFLSQLVLTV